MATTIILSDGSIATVPPGADPDAFRKFAEAKLQRPNTPRKTKKQSPRKSSRRSNYAKMQSAINAATLELVERVNNKFCTACQLGSHCGQCICCSGHSDGPQPDPDGGYQIVINGEPALWANTAADARRGYDDYYRPQPVVWNFNGQTVDLGVL